MNLYEYLIGGGKPRFSKEKSFAELEVDDRVWAAIFDVNTGKMIRGGDCEVMNVKKLPGGSISFEVIPKAGKPFNIFVASECVNKSEYTGRIFNVSFHYIATFPTNEKNARKYIMTNKN